MNKKSKIIEASIIVITFIVCTGLIAYANLNRQKKIEQTENLEISQNEEQELKAGELYKEVGAERVFESSETDEIMIDMDTVNKIVDFYSENKSDEEIQEIKEDVIKEITDKEILYREATKLGYEASEEEIQEYIDNMKQQIAESQNSKSFENFISGYGKSEDEYWKEQKDNIRKNICIDKYLAEQDNYSNITIVTEGSLKTTTDMESDWESYVEEKEDSYNIVYVE